MAEFDLEHLLGGYATNTLTETEHQALFRAAMVNQRLFDLLADEQALKELLDDPGVRRRLLQQLKEPATSTPAGWLDRAIHWATRWDTLAVSGSLAVLALATFFGWNLYQESQRLVREEAAKPGLSDVLREPTVRAKLNSKPSPEPPPQAARPSQQPTTEAAPQAQAVAPHETAPRMAAASSRTQSEREAKKTSAAQPPRAAQTSDAPPAQTGEPQATDNTMEAAPAASPAPPVVLPRVPAARHKKNRADSQTSSVPAPSSAESTISPETSNVASASAPAPSSEAPPQAALTAPPDTAQDTSGSHASEAAVDPAPAVGNARTLFYAEAPSTNTAAAKTGPRADSGERPSPTTETTSPLSEARTDHTDTSTAEPAAPPDDTPAQDTPRPLALRYHQRPLPLQGAAARTDGLALRELTLQINQPGYIYVITHDTHRGWTILEPARTASTTGAAMADAHRTYRVLTTRASAADSDHRTYLVVSRQPEPALEQALTVVGTARTAVEAAAELEQLVRPLLATYPTQSLKAEQATEPTSRGKTSTFTYIADASEQSHERLIYRVPPIP